jgi:hypothetical protein
MDILLITSKGPNSYGDILQYITFPVYNSSLVRVLCK